SRTRRPAAPGSGEVWHRRSLRGCSSVSVTMTTFLALFIPFSGRGIMHRIALLSGLLALAGCTATPTVVENSAEAVPGRYDGIVNNIDDATQVAQKVCASHDKIARLRKVNDEGIGQHFGHFDCV